MKIPDVLYPKLVEGRISGPIRCESLSGKELYLPPIEGIIRNLSVFKHEGIFYAVSHLQKKSKKGFIIMDPFIVHTWYWWKLQEYSQNPDGGSSWKPGTERGFYARTPGWRWQQPDEKSNWTPWIFTKGYAGLHWD